MTADFVTAFLAMTTDFVTAFLAMTTDFVTAFLAMTVLVALQAHRNDTLDLVIARSFATKQSTN